MKIVICDDEKVYTDMLEKEISHYLTNKNISYIILTFNNAESVCQSTDYYDIAFLDIEIDDINGIEIAKKLKETNPRIILFFITAYDKYLDNAMDLNALRFFSKPLDIKRLHEGLDKALLTIDESTVEILLKNGNEVKKVYSNEIIMIEISGKHTTVYTASETFESKNKIVFWLEKLNKSYFHHVHKSFIINSNYITEYKRDEVILNNKYKAPISYRKQAEFRNYIMSVIEKR